MNISFGEQVDDRCLLLIPPTGLMHLWQTVEEEISDEFVRKALDQFNPGIEELADGVPNPAKISASVDYGQEADIWFSPNPVLPVNPRARNLVADRFGWHMQFNGAVAISGLPAQSVEDFIRRYG